MRAEKSLAQLTILGGLDSSPSSCAVLRFFIHDLPAVKGLKSWSKWNPREQNRNNYDEKQF